MAIFPLPRPGNLLFSPPHPSAPCSGVQLPGVSRAPSSRHLLTLRGLPLFTFTSWNHSSRLSTGFISQVYIGNIDDSVEERDIEDAFGKFGKIASIWIARKPPGFAFVTYEDNRDAEDAVKELDGKEVSPPRPSSVPHFAVPVLMYSALTWRSIFSRPFFFNFTLFSVGPRASHPRW